MTVRTRERADLLPADLPVLMWLSLDEWHRMIDEGELRKEDRVELIQGAMLEMEPIGGAHTGTVTRLNEHLVRAGGDWLTQIQGPLELPEGEPQPDVALIPRDTSPADVPKQAFLVVEVAVSSLRVDREVKAPLYARAEVPEYWIVDVLGRRVEVRTRPVDGEYRELRVLGEDDVLQPTAVAAPPLRVAELFA